MPLSLLLKSIKQEMALESEKTSKQKQVPEMEYCSVWKLQPNLVTTKASFLIRTQEHLKEILQAPVSLHFT